MKSTAVNSSTVTSYTQYNDLRQDASFSSFLSITANTPVDGNVNINEGNYINSTGTQVTVTGSSITGINFPTGAGNKWYVLLSLNDSGVVVKTYGSASPTPTKPATPADNLPLAYLLLSQGGTTVAQTDIIDARSVGETGIVQTGNTQTISGLKTFLNGMFKLRNVANTFNALFTNTNTADRTYTLPDKTGTLATTEEPDFYKYQIVPTVASNNLTVALKNYAGNDPSTSAPVKIQIGDTVRTITSPLSITINAGANYFNAGSSELATKEIDYFTYLMYNNTYGVGIVISRIPYGVTWNDFVSSEVNYQSEKYGARTITTPVGTDKVQNIGRFSAILSAGAGYTWSLGTGPTINHYINETRWLDASLRFYGSTGSIGAYTEDQTFKKYKMIGNSIFVKHNGRITNIGSWTGDFRSSLPFSPKIQVNRMQVNGRIQAQGGLTTKAILDFIQTAGYTQFTNDYAISTYGYSGIATNDWISMDVNYEI